MDAESESELESESSPRPRKWKYDPLLSPADNRQGKLDWEAEHKDRLAEIADNKEEAADKTAAAADAAAAAANATAAAANTTAPAPAPAPAPAANTTAPAAPPAPEKKKRIREIINLPSDLSAQHAETIRANEDATRTVSSALQEVSGILAAKDNTIKGVVANITYLTVNIGKLANKVDLQRAYIGLLHQKLRAEKLRNKKLRAHSRHTADTVNSFRQQLKFMSDRLKKQDKSRDHLENYLAKHKDNRKLPNYKDDLEIRGERITRPRHPHRGTRRGRRSRPVAGTQVYANAHYNIPLARAQFLAHFISDNAAAPPTFTVGADGIPTIVVEREDDGR